VLKSQGSSTKNKKKNKGKKDQENKKKGKQNSTDERSSSKESKGKKEKKKCSYCNRGFHPKSYCMKKTIYLMTQTLEQQHLEDFIPDNVRKNPSSEIGNGHALLAISSSPNAWVLDLGATHHMASSNRLFSYLETCSGPLIFMEDDSLI